jgi:hypothetical protein
MGSSYNQKDLDIGGLLVLAAYSDTLSLEFVADIRFQLGLVVTAWVSFRTVRKMFTETVRATLT